MNSEQIARWLLTLNGNAKDAKFSWMEVCILAHLHAVRGEPQTAEEILHSLKIPRLSPMSVGIGLLLADLDKAGFIQTQTRGEARYYVLTRRGLTTFEAITHQP